jgi:SAM-dependent methyltransferase
MSEAFIEAVPRDVGDPASCHFYHEMDLPSFGRQRGFWDLTGRFDDYVGGTPVDGRTVLDVGTATGFLSFEAERRGARVTSLDANRPEHFHQLPIHNSEYVLDYPGWRAKTARWIEELHNGYWLCHRDLGSQARCIYGDVSRLDPSVGVFDVVILGQILVHLRDGLSALAAAASVCTETIVITEGSFPNDTPIAALSGRAHLLDVSYAWYQYSHGWYREVLAMLGFASVEVSTDTYTCHHAHHKSAIELTTVIGRREATERQG